MVNDWLRCGIGRAKQWVDQSDKVLLSLGENRLKLVVRRL